MCFILTHIHLCQPCGNLHGRHSHDPAHCIDLNTLDNSNEKHKDHKNSKCIYLFNKIIYIGMELLTSNEALTYLCPVHRSPARRRAP